MWIGDQIEICQAKLRLIHNCERPNANYLVVIIEGRVEVTNQNEPKIIDGRLCTDHPIIHNSPRVVAPLVEYLKNGEWYYDIQVRQELRELLGENQLWFLKFDNNWLCYSELDELRGLREEEGEQGSKEN